MIIIFLIIIFLFIAIVPQLYVSKIIAKYRHPNNLYPYNGFQFSSKLLQENGVINIPVLQTNLPDHFDPIEKAVKLNITNYNGSDLSSLTIAAHEVGHAIQDHSNYKPLSFRTKLAKFAIFFQPVFIFTLK